MSEFSLVPAINISATGLDAENRRMEVVANNVANAETAKGPDGKVFRRRQVVFAAKLADAIQGGESDIDQLGGVELKEVQEDKRPPKEIYRPGHPDADANGYVTLPNISAIEEMVDMMTASRAYEANLTVFKTSREMAIKALEIGR